MTLVHYKSRLHQITATENFDIQSLQQVVNCNFSPNDKLICVTTKWCLQKPTQGNTHKCSIHRHAA